MVITIRQAPAVQVIGQVMHAFQGPITPQTVVMQGQQISHHLHDIKPVGQ